jgi:hypothetical protein
LFPQGGDGDGGYYGQPPPYAGGYGQAPQPAWGPQGDPRGLDLGNYMPAEQNYPAPAQEVGHFGPMQADYGDADAEYDEGLAEDDDDRSGRRRGVIIAVALVGAIAIGGAMAYTYRAFLGGGGGRAPLIRLTDNGPNKIKPDDPGGREFAHTDKKLLNRLNEPSQAGSGPDAQQDRAGEDANAPRKVRVIPIAPGGAPEATASNPPVRPAGAPVAVGVPGVVLENFGMPNSVPAQPQQVTSPARPVAVAPPVKVSIPASEAPAGDHAPPARKPAPAKALVPKLKQAAVINQPAAAPSASSGFVAVLASKKSRMDALKAFADLQQKYGDVLAAKTPDVQEADLGDKGVWYRAVVGPPGSREAASGVCSQLKMAGHAGCWVAAY